MIVVADKPAPEPRNCSNAGPKSLVDKPCRYSNGNTSVICGDLRTHAGRIAEENREKLSIPVDRGVSGDLRSGALVTV
ncbi:hypothetical protein MTY81_59620 [Mycolicibacterium sp. TY81]|nr:hypothetical protein MTY81_59620 [Mycolicibacterium sp. TY81]